jgi:hypothetical protein
MNEGVVPLFSTRPSIWIMWALIPNPSSTGQTTCQVMSEPDFWNGMESKKAKLSVVTKSSWPTAWMSRCNSRIYPSLYT